ncbi:MAG: cytochrome c [Rhodocyclales bacterium]|nr:cytochrome c [Rhodocyclales bacterium]
MFKFSKLAAIGLSAVVLAGTAVAQTKPEDAIAFRQAGYKFMAWNTTRIKMNLEGQYNKDEVIQAANAIQAIANSGMGKLYLPGTDKGKGFHDTKVKPELFTDKEGVGKVGKAFNEAANEMARKRPPAGGRLVCDTMASRPVLLPWRTGDSVLV